MIFWVLFLVLAVFAANATGALTLAFAFRVDLVEEEVERIGIKIGGDNFK